MPGLLSSSGLERSVPGDDRAAEAVVDADRDQINVLTDAVGAEQASGDAGDAIVPVVTPIGLTLLFLTGLGPLLNESFVPPSSMPAKRPVCLLMLMVRSNSFMLIMPSSPSEKEARDKEFSDGGDAASNRGNGQA